MIHNENELLQIAEDEKISSSRSVEPILLEKEISPLRISQA